MKKIKLFAPILGTIAAAGMILPTVSCGGGGQQDDDNTYKVSISDGFSISRNHAKEDAEFEADISWNDATKAINTTTMRISVGNQVLGPGDYRYTPNASDAKSGHLKIFKNVINGTVVIEVELLSITVAPIEAKNISDTTKNVSINLSTGEASVGSDVELVISWLNTSSAKYFTNLVTIFIGKEQILSASVKENGYVIKDYTETSTTLLIPGANIKDNTPITILVDLEKSAYDKGAVVDTYRQEYIKYSTYTYDFLCSPGQPNVGGLLSIDANQTLEFKTDLNKFNRQFNSDGQGGNNSPILLGLGYWTYDGWGDYIFNTVKPIAARCGYLYYNGVALDAQIVTYGGLYYIELQPPADGWGSWSADGEQKRGSITGWYTFSESYTNNFQLVIGQEHID